MGYRGEDRSREPAAWGAQSPRQSSREPAGYDDPGYGSADYGSTGYETGADYDSRGGHDGGASYDGGSYNSGSHEGHAQDPYGSGWYRTDRYSASGGYPVANYDSHASGSYPASGQATRDYRGDGASSYDGADYNTASSYNAAPTYDGHRGTSYGEVSYDSGASYNGADYNGAGHNDAGYNSAGHNGAGHNGADYNGADYSAGYNGAGRDGAGYGNTGGYDTGSYGTGGYDTGSFGTGGYDTGSYDAREHNSGADYSGADYNTGGYDTGSYRGGRSSGAYPVVEPDSFEDGNDWYARSGPIPASGFADTSSQPAVRADLARDPIRGYPPEPDPVSPGLAVTTAQPRYDEGKYVSFPGYDGVDEAPRGYDDYDDYASETRLDQAPVDYDGPSSARGFGQALEGDRFDGGYPGDQGRPDDDVLTSPAGPVKGGKSKKKAPGKKPARRSRRALVISSVVVIVLAAVAGGYEYLNSTKANSTAAQEASAPLPSGSGNAVAATQQCAKQFGTYCHIESRTDDPAALTLTNLYPPAVFDESNKSQFLLVADKLDKTCSSAVFGSELVSQLNSGKCNQVLRASYVSDNNTVMGTIGVVNLNTTNQAHYAGRIIGANDFVMPLASSKGVAAKIGKGTGVVQGEYKGHYLILTWAQFTNLKTPTAADQKQLEDFENSLVASTANIYLSRLMINGDTTSATPSASAK